MSPEVTSTDFFPFLGLTLLLLLLSVSVSTYRVS